MFDGKMFIEFLGLLAGGLVGLGVWGWQKHCLFFFHDWDTERQPFIEICRRCKYTRYKRQRIIARPR